MRRRAGERAAACSPEILAFQVPKTFFRWKATASSPCSKARWARTGGVVGSRREHKDGPETWETQVPLGVGLENPPATSRPKARETAAEADGSMGVGGSHTSDEAGERLAPEPAERRRHVPGVSFRREIWPLHRWRRTCHRDF